MKNPKSKPIPVRAVTSPDQPPHPGGRGVEPASPLRDISQRRRADKTTTRPSSPRGTPTEGE